jgi:transposase
MSFANKPNSPDSKDTAALRKEYEDKARQARESTDSASRAKLRDDKSKAWAKVVANKTNERRESLKQKQKVLAGMGLYKTDADLKAGRDKAMAETAQRVGAEGRR